jgi:hypothetical protein
VGLSAVHKRRRGCNGSLQNFYINTFYIIKRLFGEAAVAQRKSDGLENKLKTIEPMFAAHTIFIFFFVEGPSEWLGL